MIGFPIKLLKSHRFRCISFILQPICLEIFVFYSNRSYLSTPAFQIRKRWVSVELFSKYCLFWNIWFKLFSGPFYQLSCYINHSNSLSYYLLWILCPLNCVFLASGDAEVQYMVPYFTPLTSLISSSSTSCRTNPQSSMEIYIPLYYPVDIVERLNQ